MSLAVRIGLLRWSVTSADVIQLMFSGKTVRPSLSRFGPRRTFVMLRHAPVSCGIVTVTITGELSITLGEDRAYHAPKKGLVACLQLLLQGWRLKVA